MVRPDVGIERHPDIAEMRARYDMVTQRRAGQSIEGLALLAGIYLAISPWVVGFSATGMDLRVNDLICGLTVALMAVGYASAYGRTHGLSWVTPVLGAWAIVSPWVILGSQVTAGEVISNVICGLIICLLGIATAAMGAQRGLRAAPTAH